MAEEMNLPETIEDFSKLVAENTDKVLWSPPDVSLSVDAARTLSGLMTPLNGSVFLMAIGDWGQVSDGVKATNLTNLYTQKPLLGRFTHDNKTWWVIISQTRNKAVITCADELGEINSVEKDFVQRGQQEERVN